jgi:hypothetical protein
MTARKKIAVWLHERDAYPEVKVHFIWALCDLWRQQGVEVAVFKGLERMVAADVLLPHVDLTVLPEGYAELFSHYPRVLNCSVRDISKRRISRQLVTGTDAYAGAVIVKTNLNFGGLPEARLTGTALARRQKNPWWARALLRRERFAEPEWGTLRSLNPSDYKIFPSLKDVPPAVFANDSLVVERFLPEYEQGLYHLRIYQFLGERGYCVRLGSREPIVKTQSVVSREEIPIPPELVALRRELGLDYGKLDFVMRDGRVVLLDVNRTPGLITPNERLQASAQLLAPGVLDFF